MKIIITVGVVLISFLIFLSGCDRQNNSSSHFPSDKKFSAQGFGATDMKMPAFELISARDGAPHNNTEYEGKILLVTFFASWCGSCRKEIAGLKKLHENYQEQGFSVLAISVDPNDELSLKKLADKAKINYPVFIGNEEIVKQFGGISTVPVSFLVNKKGYVMKKYLSHLDRNTLSKEIEGLLNYN